MRRTVVIVVLAGALAALVATAALGAPKPPKFVACLSGENEAAKPSAGGAGNCSLTSTATPGGSGSGTDTPIAMDISADGKSVYTANYSDNSVAWFERSSKSGKLTYMGCISGSDSLGPSGTNACKLVPHHTSDAVYSGLYEPRGVAVSPDGKSVYVAAGAGDDDAIDTFSRDKATGKLHFDSCISGNTLVGPSGGGGSGACTLVPHAASAGSFSGLDRPRDLMVSSNGKSVYGVSGANSDVFWFSRSGTGHIKWKGCLTGDANVAKGTGSGACNPIPVTTIGAVASGLRDPEYVLVSPDSNFVYASSRSDASIATFKRARKGSKLRWKGCVTGSVAVGPIAGGGSGACSAIPTATAGGSGSGLRAPYEITLGAGAKFLYAAASGDSAISTFSRSRKTGQLRFRSCISGDTNASAACKLVSSAAANGGVSGFAGMDSVSVHRGIAFGFASNDSAASEFHVSKKNGKLSYRGCLASIPELGPTGSGACNVVPRAGQYGGFQAATQMRLSPDGQDIYLTASRNAGVARLAP